MTEPSEELSLRRILVPLDASPPSLAALDAAAELARRLGAELVGLFVEDVEFLRLAELPHVHHLSLPGGEGQALDVEAARAQLRALAEEARTALVAAAGRTRVAGTFRVVRGAVAEEVVAAAREADLVILGRASRPLVRRGRVGGTARATAEAAVGPVLLWSVPSRLDRGIVAVVDGSPRSRKALGLAIRLRDASTPFTVLAVGDTEGQAEARAEEARRQLAGAGGTCRFRLLPGLEAARRALASEPKGLVVVSAESPLVRDQVGTTLLDEIGAAVLLVR